MKNGTLADSSGEEKAAARGGEKKHYQRPQDASYSRNPEVTESGYFRERSEIEARQPSSEQEEQGIGENSVDDGAQLREV